MLFYLEYARIFTFWLLGKVLYHKSQYTVYLTEVKKTCASSTSNVGGGRGDFHPQHCSLTQHTNALFQLASPLFLTLLFYLRDNVKGIERCDWIMVSCCKINAQAFIENKCWIEAKTFIFKVGNYFLVTTLSARDIIAILPNDFLSKLRSFKERNRIPDLFSPI